MNSNSNWMEHEITKIMYKLFISNQIYFSNTETLVHLLKGSLGTGILAMPKAFHQAGYMSGLINTILIGILCTYGLHILVSSRKKTKKKRKNGKNQNKYYQRECDWKCKLKQFYCEFISGTISIHSMQTSSCSAFDVSNIDESSTGRGTTSPSLACTIRRVSEKNWWKF